MGRLYKVKNEQRFVEVQWMVSRLHKIASAVFYGVASVLVMYVNKIVLSVFLFPSFLCVGIGQMCASIVILGVSHAIGLIVLPPFTRDIPHRLFPLPFLYVLNLISGLGGTQKLSLPMFTVLRRFSILMTMILEYLILNVNPSLAVRVSVGFMILGSLVAASNDLAFDAFGYSMILFNDLCTSSQGVIMKKKLDAKDLGKYGLMFYNSLFMLLPAVLIAHATGDIQSAMDYQGWDNIWFLIAFGISCVCGFILNFAILLSTQYNSALTTACIGPIKNLFVTYGSMMLLTGYVYSTVNFIGITISTLGSLLYTYVTFRRQTPPTPKSRLPQSSLREDKNALLLEPKELQDISMLR